MTEHWQDLFALPPEQRGRHRVHLIGVGGTGLAPIANVLLEMGFRVSGSDREPSSRTEMLSKLGARVCIGHRREHIQDPISGEPPDVALVSSAIPEHNPEIQAARAAGVPVVKRTDFLGPLTAHRRVIAVAGTHGKTTTTGMIAHVLTLAGHGPGYIIGSEIPGLGSAAAGRSEWFVIEADEYDHAFLGLQPTLIVLTSLEWDHPDCFPDPATYIEAYRAFIRRLRPGGWVVYCQDDPRLRELARDLGDEHWLGYGSRATAQWQAREIDIDAQSTRYALHSPSGISFPVQLQTPGLHNVLNSMAAILAASRVGCAMEQSARLIHGYRGAARRFEIKGERRGVLVIDDYAHHPTEVRTTLAAARARYPDREIWAVYQPHTYSRTRVLLDQFEGAFAAADHVLVTDIYAAREAPDPTVTPELVVAASRHPQALASGDLAQTLRHLQQNLKPNSLVLILSAGDATRLAEALLNDMDSIPISHHGHHPEPRLVAEIAR